MMRPTGGVSSLFHLISYFSDSSDPKSRDFFVSATFVMVAGFIVSLGTATTGFWDWWKGIPRDRKSGPIGRAKHTQVWRTINWHATVMVTVTVLTLVFEYGFNVENIEEVWKESEEDHARAPRPGSPKSS